MGSASLPVTLIVVDAAWLLWYFRLFPDIDWVIAGGESGPKARPMHPEWARSLRDQCVAAHTPYFFKQWGEWLPDRTGR